MIERNDWRLSGLQANYLHGELLRYSAREYGQTIVIVTHDPRGAQIADRILFLADGAIVRELTEASSGEVLEVMSTLQS